MSGATGGDIWSAADLGTPLISIVIPVYNAADDLPGCLDAITGQSFRDIEIIAVNDGSTDESRGVLEARAASEPRMTVLHTRGGGPGLARNFGAGKANGRYLWFVDADDRVTPGSLAAIAGRLESVAPDVLFVDYELAYPGGRSERVPDREALAGHLPPSFTLAEYPRVIDRTMSAWNKVIRTDFFRASGAAFEEQPPHEDLPVTCLLLLEAHKLSVLDVTCYTHSQNAPGTLMTAGDPRRHFRVFRVWHAVLDQVRKRADTCHSAVTCAVYSAFFERAIAHCSYLLDARVRGPGLLRWNGLVEPKDRREFFERLNWTYLQYKPAGFAPPAGPKGVKFRLIERNFYRPYRFLEGLNRLRSAMTSLR